MSTFHKSVMNSEVVDALKVLPGATYIDATLGGGGHTKELMLRGAVVLGIDRDKEALIEAKSHLKKIKSGSLKIVKGNFSDIDSIAGECGFIKVDGILFDLGVSSFQIDSTKRGFSYKKAASKIDLRFDQQNGEMAIDLIKQLSKEDLYEILAKYSEEKHFRSISNAIFRACKLKKLNSMGDLVEIIKNIVKVNWKKTASRVLQAFRIITNDELNCIKIGLEKSNQILKNGGVCVVISYHSLEDRIVKQEFLKSNWINLTKKPIRPTIQEVKANPRARSAKMRYAQKN
ncbi:16S rRNA (cytosine(1402)-N(4))-methyltransferase RsmH [Patescibacteria group bacterium]